MSSWTLKVRVLQIPLKNCSESYRPIGAAVFMGSLVDGGMVNHGGGFLHSYEFYAASLQVLASFLAVFLAVWAGLRRLRDTEIGRLRIKCVVDLVSNRWVLNPPAMSARSVEAHATFVSALNAVPALFGDDRGVMADFRHFKSQLGADANSALIALLEKLAKKVDLPFGYVTREDLLVALS